MSLASKAGDLYYTFRFIKILTTPWNETDAFKEGLIDDKGKRLKNVKIDTKEKKSALDSFTRLAFNIKRLMNKVPGGKTTLGSYAAALFLIKESYGISDKGLKKICDTIQIDIDQIISEEHMWYVINDSMTGKITLTPGIYRMRNERVSNNGKVTTKVNDRIRVYEGFNCAGSIFGINVFPAIHLNSGQYVYVSQGEIYK